ncbi:MAG TPA: FAD-binding oxidoreductase [Firmicutes bacterium]|nr:FAD-binding oxidoreductase [Bacillota bacterium]
MDDPMRTVIQESRVDSGLIKKYAQKAAEIVDPENVSAGRADLISTCRDYWPVSSVWMLRGEVPALPQLVAWPRSTAEVSKLLALADELKIPVTPYGEGSGALGGVVPVRGGVMLDLKKMNRILDLDDQNLLVHVQCGMNGALYEEGLNRAGFTGGHFPQSLHCSTVGGWLACRAAGQFSTRYGKIEDIAVALEAVLPDGTVFSGRRVPRTATGPRPDLFLLGSEGIFGIITSAVLRIWPLPEERHFASYTFNALEDGLEAVRCFMRTGARPAVVRLYDSQETGNHFPEIGEQKCALIILIEGHKKIVDAEAAVVEEAVLAAGAEKAGPEHVERWLEKRYNISLASMLFQKGAVLDTIEVSTSWQNAFAAYLAMQKALLDIEGTMLASGHYSHVYPDGAALYITTVGFPGEDKISYYRRLWDAAMKACLDEGAAISHHHGIGLHRGLYMAEEHGPGLEVLRRIKKALDPNGIMNPGKLGLEEVRTWLK